VYQAENVASILARRKAIKAGKAHIIDTFKGVKTTMKYSSFICTCVLNKMCEIIKRGVRTEKGCKEVHLKNVAKKVVNFYGSKVSPQQVYKHLRKWRTKWIHVSKLIDLSGTQWDGDTCIIILEVENYRGHGSVLTLVSVPPTCHIFQFI
jgi:hypothetical protein